MARPLRIEYPGAWYHVLNRGRRREPVFFSEKDYIKFLKTIEDASALYNLEVHAYSLMPNHYHLLVCTPEGNLSKIMKYIDSVYTQYINRGLGYEGALFKGRFKSILINEDEYLLELVRYIHRNPFKAKLEKKLGEHRWTSHRAYMNERICPGWLSTKTVLRKFSRYGDEARKQMDLFVKKEPPRELEKRLDGINWPAILGGEGFKEIIRQQVLGKVLEDRALPQRREIDCSVDVEEVVRITESACGIGEGALSRPRMRGYAEVKKACVYVCRAMLGIPSVTIGKALGGITGGMMTRLYQQARDEVQGKRGCSRAVRKIARCLKQ